MQADFEGPQRDADSIAAFEEYTKVCQQAALLPSQQGHSRVLNQFLLQDLKELLDSLEPNLKSSNDSILAILRHALRESNNRQFLLINQPFLGCLVDYFCGDQRKYPSLS